MSGLLALAKPRRIKASHRRRGKVASGHRRYANNNPYAFIDPDGRQSRSEAKAERDRASFCGVGGCDSGSFNGSAGGSTASVLRRHRTPDSQKQLIESVGGDTETLELAQQTHEDFVAMFIGVVAGGGPAAVARTTGAEALGLRLSAHGALRFGINAERGGSITRLALVNARLFGTRTLQSDGARVYFVVQEGRVSFAVFGRANTLVTSGYRWGLDRARKVAARYGWEIAP